MNYLIPANTKKGELFLGIFRVFDLILFGFGVLATLILLVWMPMNDTMQVVLVMLPAGICTFLIIPIPNYHNILTIILECYAFLTNRQRYVWKGWCVNDGKKKIGSAYTEDWLPVESIQNGMIVCSDKNKVTGVKIAPRNIFILDAQAQDNVLISLKNFYNMIDFEFWLVVADRPVDISVYMSQLQLLYNDTPSPAIRKIIMQDIEKGNTFMNNSIVDTEYYILFKDKNPDNLQKRIRLLINGLASCGLNASQVSNDDLRLILDNFLNGGKTTEFGTVMPL